MADLNDPEVLEEFILGALRARDTKGVQAGLTVLASVDPHRAERIRAEILEGLAIAAARGQGASDG